MKVHATMMIQKVHQMMKMKKKKILVVKKNATDDENDDEEISDTQQLTEVNIFGKNENTEKSLQTKTLKKVKKKDA